MVLADGPAIGTVDVPRIETGYAEFDIVAEAGKSLSGFYQVPNGPCLAVVHGHAGLAETPLDQLDFSSRCVVESVFADIEDVLDLETGVEHICVKDQEPVGKSA